ncbi:uncharacterized protein H6S33_001827 [Morchella sextelata]|uniref:uncharacterized protein n=1 Tax=Morchella sextelata TaxID=1174677 RepID=UPI001D0580C8|nr:uncharacterized protein H6S33_001827 [Morchella sextelata]KAH0608693.1 hypothetical protein H6S33_001827 [Morchella sextelata]
MAERDAQPQHKSENWTLVEPTAGRGRGSASPRDLEEPRKSRQGGHGTVYLQRNRATDKLRAVKTLQREYLEERPGAGYLRELQVLTVVSERPDLFAVYSRGYNDSSKDLIPISTEFHRDGDLEKYLEDQGALGDESAKRITKNLLEALEFLHEKGISHRDVKPENVLIVSKVPLSVKLTNFAISVFSKPSGGSTISLRQGTLAYMAPELFGIFGREIGCTNPADIWALGCLLFKMFTLKTPFMERQADDMKSTKISTSSGILASSKPIPTDMKLLVDFCKGAIPLPRDYLQSRASKEAVLFLKKLLVADPRLRISATAALKSWWMIDLQTASETGQTGVVKQLLQMGERADAGTAIVLAARNGHIEAVKLLLIHGRGASIGGQKALQLAAENGHADVVRLLIENGHRKNCQRTLQLAVKNGHAEVVGLLLGSGFDANPLYYGPLMLQEAAGRGHFEVVRELLKNGAEVNPIPGEPYEQTALQAAARNGHRKVAMLLLNAGADVNAKPGKLYGQTALQAALETGHLRMGKLLLKNGANPNVCYHGPTTLTAAAGSGIYDWVKLLLENRAEINAKPGERNGKTALQVAAELGYTEIVTLLLDYGANANFRYHGPTALQLAAENGHFEVVKELLAKGAEVNAKPSKPFGRTAFQGAVEGGHLLTANLLLEEGADINAWYSGFTTLRFVAGNGNAKAVSFLLTHGVDIHAKPGKKSKKTPLQAAVKNGHFSVVKLLLEGGHVTRGQHTLRLAAKKGRVDIVRFLLDTNVDGKPRHRGHALETAAANGHLGVVQILLANIEASDEPWKSYGKLALDAAIEHNHVGVKRLLLDSGFTPSRRTTP